MSLTHAWNFILDFNFRTTHIPKGNSMETKSILITGANGEIGHGLISYFAEREGVRVVALDLNSLDDSTRSKCYRAYTGDILDGRFLDSMATAMTLTPFTILPLSFQLALNASRR